MKACWLRFVFPDRANGSSEQSNDTKKPIELVRFLCVLVVVVEGGLAASRGMAVTRTRTKHGKWESGLFLVSKGEKERKKQKTCCSIQSPQRNNKGEASEKLNVVWNVSTRRARSG